MSDRNNHPPCRRTRMRRFCLSAPLCVAALSLAVTAARSAEVDAQSVKRRAVHVLTAKSKSYRAAIHSGYIPASQVQFQNQTQVGIRITSWALPKPLVVAAHSSVAIDCQVAWGQTQVAVGALDTLASQYVDLRCGDSVQISEAKNG